MRAAASARRLLPQPPSKGSLRGSKCTPLCNSQLPACKPIVCRGSQVSKSYIDAEQRHQRSSIADTCCMTPRARALSASHAIRCQREITLAGLVGFLPHDRRRPMRGHYQLGLVTTLEAFRHNPTNVALYQSPVELVLSHWFEAVVPLVLHSISVKIAFVFRSHTSRVKLTCLTTV